MYKTSENFQDAFKQFASQIKPNGFLIYEDSIKVNFSTLTNVSHLTYSCENKSDVYAIIIGLLKEMLNMICL